MLKKLVCFFSLIISSLAYSLLGPHMLENSHSEYLLDWEKTINDPETTKQIGDELYERDYISTVSVYDPTVGSYDEQPTLPGSGYTVSEGRWVWIPDFLNADTGIWYWILKTKSYFLSYLDSIIVHF